MARQSVSDFSPDDVVYLDRGEGTTALVHRLGGTLISWKVNSTENFFVSTKAIFDNKTAIKGGGCISFPHFGPWDLGPVHGFVRNKMWTVAKPPTKNSDGDVVAAVQLEDDEETRAIWNFKFRLVETFTLKKNSLVAELVYENTDTKSWDFTSCVHTFFRVARIETTSLTGLRGASYLNLETKETFKDEEEELKINGYITRAYINPPMPVTVTSGPAPPRKVALSTSNYSNIVLWNPWIELTKEFPDLDEEGYKEFVCVEAGNVLDPITLTPGSTRVCTQIFSEVE